MAAAMSAEVVPPPLGSCLHVQNFKETHGLSAYSLLHTNFVTCLNEGSALKKAEECMCHVCGAQFGRLHACLYCVYIGCFEKEHMKKHFQETQHIICMDLKFGNIFCHECNDYKYDTDFESLSKKYKEQFNKLSGLPVYSSWEPTLEEIQLIEEFDGIKRVPNNSNVGLRGLINLGQTCSMNCILQVLVHTPLLREYFFSDSHVCEMEDPRQCLVCEMFVIFQEFYSGDPNPLVPSRIVYLMWTYAKHLNGYHQQDAHEFYLAILDIMHKQSQGKNPDETKHCNCIIDQVFKGFYQSDIVCQECSNISTTYDPFLDISLNIAGTANDSENEEPVEISLLSCISKYTQPENLPIKCTKCGSASRTKQLTLKVLPVVTCFHLKRLEHSSGSKKKNMTHVNFPEFIDMSPYMSSSLGSNPDGQEVNKFGPMTDGENNKYSLYAVVNHKGDQDVGHYTAYIRQNHNKWFKCDDSNITFATRSHVFASEGYLLFYHKHVLEYSANSTLLVPEKDLKLLELSNAEGSCD